MKFKGWKPIFSFTYLQHVKSKAFIGSTIIVCALLIIIAVIISVFAFSGDEIAGLFGGNEDKKNAEVLYIYNETDIPSPDQGSLEDIQCVEISESEFEQKLEEIKATDKAEVMLHVFRVGTEDYSPVTLRMYRPENNDAVGNADELAAQCTVLYRQSLLMSIGVDENDLDKAQTYFSSEVMVYGSEVSMIKQLAGQAVTIIMAAMLFVFIMSYAQLIAQSVAMEKTSRVIELLITSVRPLAIVVGKVFAMLLVVLTQLAIIGAVGGAAAGVVILIAMSSGAMSGAAEGIAAVGEAAAEIDMSWQTELMEAVPGLFNPMAIITIIIVFLLGFIFYALLAALVGAGISRSEDLANGLQPLMFVAVIGFFLSYMPACFNMGMIEASETAAIQPDILTIISRYLPISSPFALPSAILLGQMSALETAAAVVILAGLVFGTILLVAKVYENIILYSGSPLKLGQIIKMARAKQ